MATKLGLYKGALRVLGETSISSLTSTQPARYVLDEIYDDGFLDEVLMEGLWNFAMKTVKIESTGDISPDFGYTYAFEKPSDWLRTAAVSDNEDFYPPYREYADEQDYWFAWIDPLYVKYVSSGSTYGYDLSRWPSNFTRFAQARLAAHASERIQQNRTKKIDAMQIADQWLSKARATDAINQPAGYPPPGTWTTARHRGIGGMSRYNGGWRRN